MFGGPFFEFCKKKKTKIGADEQFFAFQSGVRANLSKSELISWFLSIFGCDPREICGIRTVPAVQARDSGWSQQSRRGGLRVLVGGELSNSWNIC